jgi:hypothetical protein
MLDPASKSFELSCCRKIAPQQEVGNFFEATLHKVLDGVPSVSQGFVKRADAGMACHDAGEPTLSVFLVR